MLFGDIAYKLGMSALIKDVAERCALYRKSCLSLIEKKKRYIIETSADKDNGCCTDIIEALVALELKQKEFT